MISVQLAGCQSAQPTLSADTLIREYAQSSNIARSKYDGKEITVNGLAESIASLPLDGADQGSVWLAGTLGATGKVGCWFSRGQAAEFSKIKSGQHLTIKGIFNGEAGVDLKFCRLVKVE